jgi:hypothetical protein
MYNYMLVEMAEAVSKKCNVCVTDALSALTGYWQDKIAHVWQVEDLLETACQAGKPITCQAALELLKSVFDDHDSALGITWQTLEVALNDYRLSFADLTAETYSEVHGVFKVWREHDPIAHQFGVFPNRVAGNFPPALDFARALAREHSGVAVLVSCESSTREETRPWLIIRQEDNKSISILESEVMNHVPME